MFKNLSIKTKLSILSILSLILLASSISYIAIKKSSEALLDDKFAQLSTVEVAKHGELKKYFDGLSDLLTSMAASEATKGAFKNFDTGFKRLDQEVFLDDQTVTEKLKIDYRSNYLDRINFDVPNSKPKGELNQYIPHDKNGRLAQYIFITDNPAPVGKKNNFMFDKKYNSLYMNTHKRYHNMFNKYLESFGLYDIFLINNEGDIIYTVFKEKDFATNLYKDRYKDSGLAKVFKKALDLKKGKLAFEDFSPYEPTYNQSAAFIATPIFEDDKKIGVLAFQIPVKQLNSIMQFNGQYERAGLGKSGECYLVGSDYLMRSNARYQNLIEDKVVKKLGTTVGVWEIRTKSTEAVMNGDTHIGKWIIKDYLGKDVLSVYHTVNVFNTAKWAIVAEIDKDEALKPAREIRNYLLLMIVLLLALSLVITLIAIRKTIFKPLIYFQEELIHFFEFLKTGKGKIKLLKIKSNDEIGQMLQFVNEGILEVQHTLSDKKSEEWIKIGIGEFNALLMDNVHLQDIVEKGLRFISRYSKSKVGVVYLYEKENDLLKRVSYYSYTKTGSTKESYLLGDGVVGQVGLQKAPIILIDEIKDNTDMVINSALKQTKPRATYTYPLVYQNELFGVVELGALKKLDEKTIEFFNGVTKAMATAIATAQKNQKVEELLVEAEEHNKQLQNQQQKLEEANTAMEEQQHQLEVANTNLEEQQQQLEEANALMEEQQQQLELQNHDLQKAKEEVLKKAEDLELSNKYKSEFLANMSHELRTPLNAIILLSQLLAKNKFDNLNEDDVKKAQTIYNSGNELLRLINDILDLSKVEAGKIEIIIDQFVPKELLEDIKNLYMFNAHEKNISLHTVDNYHDLISSDKDRISQILKNLVSNALKFTHEGSITLEINKLQDTDKPVQITVKDTGIGIPQKKQKLIFEAFTQADGSTSREYGGTGLGLSITKELVYLLGGEISLESQEGRGSTFIINLPNLNPEDHLLKEPLKIKESPSLLLEHKDNTASIENPVKDDRDIIGMNNALLIIDDDVAFCEIVYDTIKRNQYFGLVAHSGKEGLEILKEYNISGIMLDLTLPDTDGVEILKKIKGDKKLQNIPVYIISSKDKDEKLIQMGAKGYGQKPLLEDDIEEIISTLDQFIKDHKEIKNNVKEERVIFDEIDLEGINVLIVDDDIKNIFVLDNILNESNAKVFTAYNGQEAIDQLKINKDIDIVLMDIMMPVMSGYEAIQAIRADDELKTIPIIAVTAKVMKEDRDQCIALGADDFVSKPIDMDALISLVKVWSDKKHQ